MAVRKVKASVNNVGKNQKGNFPRELTGAHNDLAGRFDALLAKLDADAGVAADYTAVIGGADTIQFENEETAPS